MYMYKTTFNNQKCKITLEKENIFSIERLVIESEIQKSKNKSKILFVEKLMIKCEIIKRNFFFIDKAVSEIQEVINIFNVNFNNIILFLLFEL